MPLTQPRRHNPLMLGYFERIGLSGKALAKVCGVSHSQMMMARTRNVGPDNARKIASCIARRLGLSFEDELALRAEIMGHPGNLVRAYLGSGRELVRALGVSKTAAHPAVSPPATLPPVPGAELVRRLRETGAPPFVVESVESRVRPPAQRPPGRRTHDHAGESMGRQKRETRERLPETKPQTARAIEEAGFSRKELYQRAGIGRETLRKALYNGVGEWTAQRIVAALGDALDLPKGEREAIRAELMADPKGS